MNISNLPKNILKKCKGCGDNIQGGIHHTLCEKCWIKVHGLNKDVKSEHSKVFLINVNKQLKEENIRLNEKVENQKEELRRLQYRGKIN